MHDANTCGTAVWIHRVLATVFPHRGTGIPAVGDCMKHRVTRESSLT
jgi:hypothetical protein